MARQNATDDENGSIEDCGNCETLALRMAPGESVDCEDCGRTLVREDGEIPNEIRVQNEEEN